MRSILLAFVFLPFSLAQGAGELFVVRSAANVFSVEYPGSTKEGELVYGVTYTVWIPPDVKTIRGIIVHQHGCGKGACDGGKTAAYDLHWQALAKKWDCALLGPNYHQEDGQECRLWCDPRNGSEKAFLKGLSDLAEKSGHPELDEVPWCLWGHSGGGFWSSIMQTLHPKRIVAIWFRSGTAYEVWERGEIPKPEFPEEMFGIPMMVNPGIIERDEERFRSAWTGATAMFKAYRVKGAPIGFAADPKSGHECGGSRYLAIPFFDACLELRLPKSGYDLKAVETEKGWLADFTGNKALPAAEFQGEIKYAIWLPNKSVAKAWEQYLTQAKTEDATAPPAPNEVVIKFDDEGNATLSWSAEADFESGLSGFVILRDGKEIAKLPEDAQPRFNQAALFQPLSYHDTPTEPVPEMKYVVPSAKDGEFSVLSINSVGLKSTPTKAKPAR